MELQRREADEQMLERIRRRVAGDTKLDLPRPLQRLRSFLTPRSRAAAAAAADDTSQQSTPAASARRPAAAAAASAAEAAHGAIATPHLAAGHVGAGEPGVTVADDVAATGCAAWWPRVQAAAAQLTTHPDFQLVVMLVIALNCTGGCGGSGGRGWVSGSACVAARLRCLGSGCVPCTTTVVCPCPCPAAALAMYRPSLPADSGWNQHLKDIGAWA